MPSTPLDPVDRQLIAALQADARQTNRSLASKVEMAPSTTLHRVRELERRGVITGYHADIDLGAIGRGLQALVFIRLQPKSDRIIANFMDVVWSLPETIAVDLISGTEDAVVHLAVADTEALRNVILNQIGSIDGVLDERTSILFEHRRKPVIEPLPDAD